MNITRKIAALCAALVLAIGLLGASPSAGTAAAKVAAPAVATVLPCSGNPMLYIQSSEAEATTLIICYGTNYSNLSGVKGTSVVCRNAFGINLGNYNDCTNKVSMYQNPNHARVCLYVNANYDRAGGWEWEQINMGWNTLTHTDEITSIGWFGTC